MDKNMGFFTKKTMVPVSNTTEEIETVQLWQVTWCSRHGDYFGNTSKEFEVFTSEQDAKNFVESLRAAFKLIRHTSGNDVKLEKRQ